MKATEPKDPTGRVNQAELARRLKVTRGAVSKAVKSGRITPDEDGLFDPAEAELQWIANSRPHMRPSDSPAAKSKATGYAEARARKENALAVMAELRLHQATKTLVPREAAEYAMLDLAVMTRRYFEDLPARVAPLVAPITDLEECMRILDDYVRQALTDISEALMRREKDLKDEVEAISGPRE